MAGFFSGVLNGLKSISGSGLLGGIVSGVGNAIAGSVVNKGYNAQQDAYNRWINDRRNSANKVIYQDPTQNANNVAAITAAQQINDAQTQKAAATNAVTGGTDESVALSKQAAAANTGNMMTQQAMSQQARQDAAQQQLNSAEDSYAKYIAASKLQQAQAKGNTISNTAKGVGESLNSLLNPIPNV